MIIVLVFCICGEVAELKGPDSAQCVQDPQGGSGLAETLEKKKKDYTYMLTAHEFL